MKKLLSLLLALVLLASAFPFVASAEGIYNHENLCTTCKEVGDMDQNDVFDTDDAMYLVSSLMFPERYRLCESAEHVPGNCPHCIGVGDMDQNGKLDTDDALFLLLHVVYQGNRFRLPGCFYEDKLAVGYARADITPEGVMEIYGSTADKGAHDPLQMTCTAVDDGTSTALLFSLDLRSFSVSFTKTLTDIIDEKFDIPADHVMFNITHTHSTPSIGNGTAAGVEWRAKICSQLEVVVQEALDDLDEVVGAYTGVGYTDGITFVRRYLLPDGTYQTNPSAAKNPVAHETEADNEMRTLRIDRKNKKDVLMVNYQTHYGSATGLYKNQYSADFVHVFREEAEKKWDCHFVYHSGASGNLNFNSAISGERKYPTFVEATKEGFIPTVEGCLADEREVSLGKLRFASSWVEAPVYQDTPEDIANAKIVNKSGYDTESAEYKALLEQYNFDGYRHVQGIITRAGLGETLDVPFYAISFGDIGFASSPYEMFDTNGKQVRDGSPFETTFVCSYTNGGLGYVPSEIAFPHKAYEVYISRFCAGAGEDFADEMIRLLNDCKSQDQ